MVLLKLALRWEHSCYKLAKKLLGHVFLQYKTTTSNQRSASGLQTVYPSVTECSSSSNLEGQTIVCDDFHGTLLRAPDSLFPYFMLVAFEGGSLLRALLLLALSPALCLLGKHEFGMRIMAFVTFCGMRTGDLRLIARTVLPKIFLENLHLQACEALKGRRAVVLTTLPRLMVEGFLKEYLEVGEVVGAELQVVKGCYFTGVISWPDKQRALRDMVKAGAAIVNLSNVHHHHHLLAKEIYVVREEESRSESSKMTRNKYPKPLVFHDGRLAFLPTPCEMMAFFMWIPMAIPLAVFRIAMGIVFPYKISIFIAAVTGIRFRRAGDGKANGEIKKGVVYVCTHRTLLDPVMLCSALERTVPAVTYSLSRVSEALAPMRTVRLTRDRGRDAATMRRLLAVEGGLAVCPEGTTCREPYLLRFSPLFAEVAEEVVPVALDARVGMLYATTASGHKWLDPVVFMMNPTPGYEVHILPPVRPREMTTGEEGWSAAEVANRIQKQLAEKLGFECTALTRRDKYMMLAGNEGVAAPMHRREPEKQPTNSL
ncbi:glycerol-3-phosphate acyltransferase 1-like [Zingiber officinale]|uniref:Phospholipid/glycerol acyltransferase domain-containing protein n=1 Tax=Zingiber officinale TaxID=94328 RepID=A0A8J5I964_ZINOF|nr:glycerol-3-phosphate acyltransferase 1-like [Zingiber officinale]KAG6529870.1 hypothetical protein ZIOFF_012085 [Zingiber officinale]